MSKKTLTELLDYIAFHVSPIKKLTSIHHFVHCTECREVWLICDYIRWTSTAHKDSVQTHNANVWVNGEWYRLTEHNMEVKEEKCIECKSKTKNILKILEDWRKKNKKKEG